MKSWRWTIIRPLTTLIAAGLLCGRSPGPAASPAPLRATPGATSTSAAADAELAVLQQTAQSMCPAQENNPFSSPQVAAEGTVYRFDCIPAAGHSTTATIERYSSLAEAQAAFDAATAGHPIQDLHGHPGITWEQANPDTPDGTQRVGIWQVDRWLITVKSSDDTHYPVALDPGQVAESIYQSGVRDGLFSK